METEDLIRSQINALSCLIKQSFTEWRTKQMDMRLKNYRPVTQISAFVNHKFTKCLLETLMFQNSFQDSISINKEEMIQMPEIVLNMCFTKFGSTSFDLLDIKINDTALWLSVFNDVQKTNFVTYISEIAKDTGIYNSDDCTEKLLTRLQNKGSPGIKLLALYLIFQCNLHCLLRCGVYVGVPIGICNSRIIVIIIFLFLNKLDDLEAITSNLYVYDKEFHRTLLFEFVSSFLMESGCEHFCPSLTDIHNASHIKSRSLGNNMINVDKQRHNDLLSFAYSQCLKDSKVQNLQRTRLCSREIATLGCESLYNYFRPNYDPNLIIQKFLRENIIY